MTALFTSQLLGCNGDAEGLLLHPFSVPDYSADDLDGVTSID